MTLFATLDELAAHHASHYEPKHPSLTSLSSHGVELIEFAHGQTHVGEVWKSQPALRKVVNFIASRVATIPLHVYEHKENDSRERVRTGDLYETITDPAKTPGISPKNFWERLIIDKLIYDRCAALILEDGENTRLVRIPPRKFEYKTDKWDRITSLLIYNEHGRQEEWDPRQFILDVGYSQTDGKGTSPITSLRNLLAESADTITFQRNMMRRGATHTGWIEREKPWPADGKAQKKFLEGIRAFDAHAERASGTLVLDEGMKWHDRSFKPVDLKISETRKLTDIEVANAYGIPPELLGLREGTYSNIESMQRNLYGDVLAPYIVAWEQMLHPLTQRLNQNRNLYIEANIEAKLRGNFSETASAYQKGVGGPYLTPNEVRRKENLPALPGGDELNRPLNVVTGAQADPTDTGTQNEKTHTPPHTKHTQTQMKATDYTTPWAEHAKTTLQYYFQRQARSITAAIGPKANWWDEQRWNRELHQDLLDLALECVNLTGRETATQFGYDPDQDWNLERCRNYLTIILTHRAKWINETTRREIEKALAEDKPVEKVFERAVDQRAGAAGAAFAAGMVSWAMVEAASNQFGMKNTHKTWVTGRNPRATHLARNGETVPVGEEFSGGMQWPGDPSGGVGEVAGCNCTIMLTYSPG